MALPVSSLLPYLRTMLMDLGTDGLQEFTDEQLTNNYLVTTIKLENAILDNLSCAIQQNEEDFTWEFVVDPADWLQIFYCLACCLRMRSWEKVYSFDNGINKTTNHNIRDVVNSLKETYDTILQERKNNVVGYSYTTWNDFRSRYRLIANEILKGIE